VGLPLSIISNKNQQAEIISSNAHPLRTQSNAGFNLPTISGVSIKQQNTGSFRTQQQAQPVLEHFSLIQQQPPTAPLDNTFRLLPLQGNSDESDEVVSLEDTLQLFNNERNPILVHQIHGNPPPLLSPGVPEIKPAQPHQLPAPLTTSTFQQVRTDQLDLPKETALKPSLKDSHLLEGEPLDVTNLATSHDVEARQEGFFVSPVEVREGGPSDNLVETREEHPLESTVEVSKGGPSDSTGELTAGRPLESTVSSGSPVHSVQAQQNFQAGQEHPPVHPVAGHPRTQVSSGALRLPTPVVRDPVFFRVATSSESREINSPETFSHEHASLETTSQEFPSLERNSLEVPSLEVTSHEFISKEDISNEIFPLKVASHGVHSFEDYLHEVSSLEDISDDFHSFETNSHEVPSLKLNQRQLISLGSNSIEKSSPEINSLELSSEVDSREHASPEFNSSEIFSLEVNSLEIPSLEINSFESVSLERDSHEKLSLQTALHSDPLVKNWSPEDVSIEFNAHGHHEISSHESLDFDTNSNESPSLEALSKELFPHAVDSHESKERTIIDEINNFEKGSLHDLHSIETHSAESLEIL